MEAVSSRKSETAHTGTATTTALIASGARTLNFSKQVGLQMRNLTQGCFIFPCCSEVQRYQQRNGKKYEINRLDGKFLSLQLHREL